MNSSKLHNQNFCLIFLIVPAMLSGSCAKESDTPDTHKPITVERVDNIPPRQNIKKANPLQKEAAAIRSDTVLSGSRDQIIVQYLEQTLGRPADYKIDFLSQTDGWLLLCGIATELDGNRFIHPEKMLNNIDDASQSTSSFCLLMIRNAEQYSLLDSQFGNPDGDVLEWSEKYKLPNDLLKQ